ncbi:MAG: hypothetical protein ORN26_02390 [Candidatus Pacebacteria bacterium]|nr:hypothetical protein [Candidatus Paceibacterota bacterium]
MPDLIFIVEKVLIKLFNIMIVVDIVKAINSCHPERDFHFSLLL